MTQRAYFATGDLSIQATIIDIGQDDKGPWIVPDKTVAHVKGGGQKGDKGTIDDVPFDDVLGVDGRDGPARHFVADNSKFAVGMQVQIHVDREWRNLQSSYHTAGHLIAAIGESISPGLEAVGAHHYVGEARVDFAGTLPAGIEQFRIALIHELAKAIQRNDPVQIVGDPFTNRAIQIANFRPIPCGGVHLQNVGQLRKIEIRNVKAKDGRLRIGYEVVVAEIES